MMNKSVHAKRRRLLTYPAIAQKFPTFLKYRINSKRYVNMSTILIMDIVKANIVFFGKISVVTKNYLPQTGVDGVIAKYDAKKKITDCREEVK